ncbi:SDR family NAD(P)-dependent oxidoreductase [Mycobacterium leprae]|uniref:SDR family NAD(P)-dependent oxidoreductase n=1 Tax=Mycobacterium leprae TaxID=1769 RepID=UPI000673E773|nr:SDR family NAD(P)-dependent oxidoreductase [Mycobacterium leprae]OAR20732.1 hypothetical protein A8144_09300 [Mycobacterium leprae 3125609]OAX70924.1 hypothetical protein A3216_09115 [Mycobacterium leprae 7935681]
MTQALLPQLWLTQGWIVLISSLVGKVTFLLIGAYCASKFPLEAMGDVLSIELKRWNGAVALIEPGATDTEMYWNGHDMFGWHGLSRRRAIGFFDG